MIFVFLGAFIHLIVLVSVLVLGCRPFATTPVAGASCSLAFSHTLEATRWAAQGQLLWFSDVSVPAFIEFSFDPVHVVLHSPALRLYALIGALQLTQKW